MNSGGATRPPLRLCLCGGWFESRNVGDNAILAGIADSIQARQKSDLTVFTSNPDRVARAHGLSAVAIWRNPLAVVRALSRADALVFTGGTPFYDKVGHMVHFCGLALASRLRGVPILILGISCRTLNNPLCRKLARSICRRAVYLSARDDQSLLRLDALTGSPGRTRFCPDPAVRMKPASGAWARKELRFLRLEGRGLRVAVCLRDLGASAKFRTSHYDPSYSRQDLDRFHRAVSGLCTHLVLGHRARVVFLPMHTDQPDDDRVPARECAALIRKAAVRSGVRLAEKQYGPREMKALLGTMDLVVGVRFHSLLLSACMGVPNYALSYAPKTSALMEVLDRGAYAQPIKRLDTARLYRQVDVLLASLPEQRRRLARRNRELNRYFAAELKAMLGMTRRSG